MKKCKCKKNVKKFIFFQKRLRDKHKQSIKCASFNVNGPPIPTVPFRILNSRQLQIIPSLYNSISEVWGNNKVLDNFLANIAN